MKEDIIELGEYVIDKRPSIKEKDKFKLWVRSGGRCAVCNKYLLDINYDISLGEMAHVVGWNKASRSPRGEADLPMGDRNTVENLILLCADDHKIVDTKELLEEFTIERLMQCKLAHEDRIFHLTSLGLDSQSVVLRVFGGIRGVSVELSKEHAREVIFKSERKFAMFTDSFDRHGLEINLNNLPEPEDNWEAYWSIGQSIIDNSLHLVKEAVEKGSARHLSIFALTRIPLLVYLGYRLDDKIPTDLYQKHRGENETWLWSETDAIETFKIERIVTKRSENVVLVLSLSGSIDDSRLPNDVIENNSLYVITPVGMIPNRNIMRNKASFKNFESIYHEFLSMIELEEKMCKEVHLFAAVPTTGAIVLGRGIMRDAHPALTIYDLSTTGYQKAITINKR